MDLKEVIVKICSLENTVILGPPPTQQFIPNGQFVPSNQFQQNNFQGQQVPPQFLQQQQQQQFFPNQQQNVPPAFAQPVPVAAAPPTPPPAPPVLPAQETPQPPPTVQQPPQVKIEEAPLSTTTPPPPPTPKIVPPPVDKNVDLDGDGALSLPEVQYAAFVHHGLSSSVVENMFNQVDKNRDGYLTSIEFNEIRPLVLAKAENAALRYLHVSLFFLYQSVQRYFIASRHKS